MGGFSGQFNPSLLERRGLVASYSSPDPAASADNIDEKMVSSPQLPFLTLPPPDNMILGRSDSPKWMNFRKDSEGEVISKISCGSFPSSKCQKKGGAGGH